MDAKSENIKKHNPIIGLIRVQRADHETLCGFDGFTGYGKCSTKNCWIFLKKSWDFKSNCNNMSTETLLCITYTHINPFIIIIR